MCRPSNIDVKLAAILAQNIETNYSCMRITPRVCTSVLSLMFNVHSSCPQFWGLHREERKQCYEYILHDNYSVGLDKNTNYFMQ